MVARRYAEAVERIEAFARAHLAAESVPGAAIVLTDGDGPLAELAWGAADVATGRPVEPDTVFPIASVAKTFTAAGVLQLVEVGDVDLDAVVGTYLPWLPLEGVTVRHLLTHTAGIAGGMEVSPSTVGESRSLLTLPSGPPGRRFHTSNIGYGVLGLVIEAVAGQTYGDAIRLGILEPLGMTRSTAVTTQAMRLLCATGYAFATDDAPAGDRPLAPAPWLATDSGAGSACCPAGDVAAFLRMVLRRGAGPSGRILSERSIALMETPGVDGAPFGHGLDLYEVDGHRVIGHSGDTPGFQSHMWADPEADVGIVVVWNSPGSTWAIVTHTLRLLRAAAEGKPLPGDPQPDAAEESAGEAEPGDDPRAGTYRCHNPWVPFVRVHMIDGRLCLEYPWGERVGLVALGDEEYNVGDEGSPERARFIDPIGARPLSVVVSGQRFDRTPW